MKGVCARIEPLINSESMAASKAQKQQAANMLAAGHSETETASAAKVGRSTIQHWKRQPSFINQIDSARLTLNTSIAKEAKTDNVSARMILEGLEALKVDEAAIGQRLWKLFDKVESKTLELIEQSEAEDFGPRQIPSMIKASIELAAVGFTINDRIAGIEALVSGIQRIK